MTDELNVWRDASDAASENSVKWKPAAEQRAATVIRTYGDQRHAQGYAQAVADVVEWLRVQQHGRTSDNYPGYYARQIEQRFEKDA